MFPREGKKRGNPRERAWRFGYNGIFANASRLIVAVLRGDSNVKGTVTFEQADENSPTTISWNITGHDANAERGMHVHAFGDNTNGCTSAGPHCTFFFFSSFYQNNKKMCVIYGIYFANACFKSQPAQQDARRPRRRGAPRRRLGQLQDGRPG